MSSTGASIKARRASGMQARRRMYFRGPLQDLANYLLETPISAVVVLWITCLPMLYFGLYGDILESTWTLAQMTVLFVGILLAFLAIILSISFSIALALEWRRRRRVGRHV